MTREETENQIQVEMDALKFVISQCENRKITLQNFSSFLINSHSAFQELIDKGNEAER